MIPVSSACIASSRVIAGSTAIFFVPRATLQLRTLLSGTIPISIGQMSAPVSRQKIAAVVFSFRKFSATIFVTS